MAKGDVRHEAAHPCPKCGHCPTCGRSNQQGYYPWRWPSPYSHWYPGYYPYSQPLVTYGATSSSSQSGLSYFSNTASAN